MTRIEINVTNHTGLDQLVAAGYDVAGVRGDRVVLYADGEEMESLRAEGWQPEVQEPPPAAREVPWRKGLGAYNDYTELTAMLDAYAANHRDVCRKVSLGKSVQNRDLWAMKITSDPDLELDKPEFKYVGGIHGNEPLGTELCLYFIDLLLEGYTSGDPRVVNLVDHIEIWIVPLMNPDGRESVPPRRYNASGYDLNRSFPEGSSRNLGNRLYGPPTDTNGLPPEVRHVTAWTTARNFSLSANFHTGARVINYPYDNDGRGSAYSPTPDELLVQALARTYSSNNPPMWNNNVKPFVQGIVNGAAWYSISGGMQDWHYRYDGCIELTIELAEAHWPDPPPSQLASYWSENRESMLAYLEWSLRGLRGVIHDARTGLPIRAAVRVEGIHHLVFSDPDVGDYHRLLLPGSYTVWFYAPGYVPLRIPDVVVSSDAATRLDVALQAVHARFAAQICFQPVGTILPTGYRADSGGLFGPQGDGHSYGWETVLGATNLVRRDAGRSQDLRYDTFCHTQSGGDHTWEIALPSGPYSVLLAAGDPLASTGSYRFSVEDALLLDGVPSTDHAWVEALGTVVVTDGRLTLRNAPGALNNALAFVEVSALEPTTIEQWRALHFATVANTGDAANAADPDDDGRVNLLEYTLGSDPNHLDAAPSFTPIMVRADGEAWFACEFFRNTNATDLAFRVEAGGALPAPHWDTVVAYTSGAGWSGPAQVFEMTGIPNGVTVRVQEAQPVRASTARFLRLQVTQP